MEVNLSIKGVPADIADLLRQRAERNHRSLQGELMSIIEQAARTEPGSGLAPQASASASGLQTLASHPVKQGWKSIEQIAAEHKLRHPKPFRDLPRAVDIIRKDRDER